MEKKFIVSIIILFAIIVFTIIAEIIAPYMICLIGQILYDKLHIIPYEGDAMLVYNWLLGFIVLVLCVITITLFRRDHLRIYTLLFIPHIVALFIAMLYIGINIRYMGDGIVRIERFSSDFADYRDSKGKVIIHHTSKWLYLEHHNGTVVLTDGLKIEDCIRDISVLYNENGTCFLKKPKDDEDLDSFSDFYYSGKFFSGEDGYFSHERVRFFNKYGDYMITREYGLGGYSPERESGEVLSEYIKKVDELPDGTKIFEIK